MAVISSHLRVFRIHQRPDGRFEIRNEFPKDSPLATADSLEQAMETGHREALTESQKGSVVVVEAQRDGKWIEVERVKTPAASDIDAKVEELLGEAKQQKEADHLYRCPRCNQVVDQSDLRDCLRHETPGHERPSES
jgi:hypothetical protein